MAAQDRRARERAERHHRILEVARGLAEEAGWDAVTTRRLAERIEYSQPVLYSHFPGGKEAIVAAVALEGFVELRDRLRDAAVPGSGRTEVVAALVSAYLGFAAEHPATYDAMFERADLPFAVDDTPAPLREGFTVLRDALGDDTRAEVGWACLHGLAALGRAGRLPASAAADRAAVLVGWASSE